MQKINVNKLSVKELKSLQNEVNTALQNKRSGNIPKKLLNSLIDEYQFLLNGETLETISKKLTLTADLNISFRWREGYGYETDADINLSLDPEKSSPLANVYDTNLEDAVYDAVNLLFYEDELEFSKLFTKTEWKKITKLKNKFNKEVEDFSKKLETIADQYKITPSQLEEDIRDRIR